MMAEKMAAGRRDRPAAASRTPWDILSRPMHQRRGEPHNSGSVCRTDPGRTPRIEHMCCVNDVRGSWSTGRAGVLSASDPARFVYPWSVRRCAVGLIFIIGYIIGAIAIILVVVKLLGIW